MALSFSRKGEFDELHGHQRAFVFDVTFDTSYPTGGEAFAASDIPGKALKEIAGVEVIGGNAVSHGVLCKWDSVTRKLLLFFPTGGTVSPATLIAPLTTQTAGATPVTSDDATATLINTGGIAKEIKNATNAALVTVRLRVFGV